MPSQLNLPLLPRSPMFVGETMTREWQEFFRQLFVRVGEHESLTIGEMDDAVTALLALDPSSWLPPTPTGKWFRLPTLPHG